jgi:hypothetical protein
MVGREAAIRARRYNQPAFNNSMRDSANAAAAFYSGSTGVQEPCRVSGVAEDRGCRSSNAHRLPRFQRAANYFIRNPQSYLSRIFCPAWSVERIFFHQPLDGAKKWAKAHHLIRLRRHAKMRKILTMQVVSAKGTHHVFDVVHQ